MSTPRVSRIRPRAKLTRRLFGPVSRSSTFLILFFILLATTLYSGSSASSFPAKSDSSSRPESIAQEMAATLPGFTALLLMAPQQAPYEPETITTYAADCTTPKSDFNFGDTVCAKIDGGIPLSIASRRFAWVDPDNRVLTRVNVTTVPQTNLFQLPARDLLDDKRGVWRVNSISSRSSVRASAFFNVSDPNDAAADVLVYNNVNTDTADVAAGSNIEFSMWISNQGPNTATNVSLTNAVNGGATFIQSVQDSGPAFTCSPNGGGTDCTIASLAPGDSARIRVVYQVAAGSVPGTVIVSTATISSATADQFTNNNSSVAEIIVTDNSPGSFCSLICPGNVVQEANTEQNGQAGAIVSFGTGETSGECGTITATPASGSFFAAGTTTVTLSSSTGESCTFNVIITDGDDPPTIACPANVNKDAGNDCSTEVTAAELGEPTATGNGVTVSGERSDSQPLEAPYPVGTTTITWTATDVSSRTTSCSQTVTVTGNDTTEPTLTAPADVTEFTGATGASCGKIVGETELGTATAEDACSTANVTRSGVPAGNFFPVGETTVTYTATDGAGNTTTKTQKVIISDNTPPVIEAPADPGTTYTCPSDVPAANPAEATRGEVLDENGNPLPPAPPSDNCGAPTVTVSETSSGAGSASDPMIITRTFTATDAAGNTASDTQTITVIDDVPPSITLNGAASMTVECHTSFTDPGASTSDNCANVAPVSVSGTVDVNTPGTYTLTYTGTDAAGNQSATLTRTVEVVDTTAPTIALEGDSPMTVECHTSFTDPGATASDSCAGDLTNAITVAGSVNPDVVGSYTLTYSVSDGHGNNASVSRTVNVVDTTAPTVTLNGANPMTVECHTSFTDPGATASDSCAGDLTSAINASGSVNVNVPGTYTRTYTVSDGYNTTTVTRTVNVVDTIAPTINLNGQNITFWPPNHSYKTVNVTDLVASVTDSCDTSIAVSNVVISKVTSDETENGNGDGNTFNDIVIAANCKSVQLRAERNGSGNGRVYTITFRVKDASGNVTTTTAKVKVPKSNGNGGAAVDDGPSYTVNGNCP